MSDFLVWEARVSAFAAIIQREFDNGRIDDRLQVRSGYYPSDEYVDMLLHGDRVLIEKAHEYFLTKRSG